MRSEQWQLIIAIPLGLLLIIGGIEALNFFFGGP